MALMIQPPNGYIIALTSILGTLTLSREKKKKLHISIFLHPFPPLFSHTLLPFLQNYKTTPDAAIQTQAFKKGKS